MSILEYVVIFIRARRQHERLGETKGYRARNGAPQPYAKRRTQACRIQHMLPCVLLTVVTHL